MMMVRKSLWVIGLIAVSITACRDKEAEKKIAALEARLAEVENSKRAAPTPVAPAANPADQVKPEGPLPTIQFTSQEHDFGTIKEGDKVTHVYKFKNTGDAPLIIEKAQPTCGCTVPDWSKEPIPPGGEGYVKAEFDSNGKPNMQHKSITVTSNAWPKQTILTFKAMVTPRSNTPVQ
jgi:hypothetical protein